MTQKSFTAFALCLAALPLVAFAQTAPSAPPQPMPAPQQAMPAGDPGSDRFGGLRENADRFRAVYEKLDSDNMTEIDNLMRTKRCQINRVDGLLNRVVEALDQWNDAEVKYWTVWANAEADRVEGQQKSLASMEAEQKRAEELVISTQKDREALLRDKGNLEKYGARTETIRKQIDSLVQDIKESESRLAEAQKNYDEVSIKVRNMQASINARLIDMRQNKQRVEAYGLEMKSYYEKTRAAAQEICNTKQPDTTRPPLPTNKKKTTPPSQP